jgi:hypothetical protein
MALVCPRSFCGICEAWINPPMVSSASKRSSVCSKGFGPLNGDDAQAENKNTKIQIQLFMTSHSEEKI